MSTYVANVEKRKFELIRLIAHVRKLILTYFVLVDRYLIYFRN